jgi:hypothetical protein
MEKEFRVHCVALLQSTRMTCTILAESEEEARKKMEYMGSDYLNQDKLLDELARYDVYIEDIEDIEIRQVGD